MGHGGYFDETETVVAGVLADADGAPVVQCSLWLRPMPHLSSTATLHKVETVIDSPFTGQVLITDASGAFEFSGMPGGSYVLSGISPQSGLGIQAKFTIQSKDTANTDTLQLDSLVDLVVPLGTKRLGQTVWIPELGWNSVVLNDTLRISGIPQGSYTLVFHADSSDWLLQEANPAPYRSDSISRPGTTVQWFNPCYGKLTDLRDQQTYGFIKIDSLYWLQRNMSFASAHSRCNPAEPDTGSCFSYGRYYDLADLADVCPEGWRVSSVEHWNNLFYASGGIAKAGSSLKSGVGWNEYPGPGNGSSLYWLQILPAGTSMFPELGKKAVFWTSDITSEGTRIKVSFYADKDEAFIDTVRISQSLSVRCVRPVSQGL